MGDSQHQYLTGQSGDDPPALLRTTYDIVPDELDERAVGRARLVVGVWVGLLYRVVALDADRGDLVRLPIPDSERWEALALAPDGRHLLATARDAGGLLWYRIASGEQRLLPADRSIGEIDHLAVISADGQHAATLSVRQDPDDRRPEHSLATLNTVDIATGQRRQLWHTPGGWSSESGIGCSPDGQRIAATYLTMQEEIGTVVVDMDGRLIEHIDGVMISPSGNGAWLNNHHLRCLPEYTETFGTDNAVILDIGHRRHQPTDARIVAHTRIGDRLIHASTHISPTGVIGTRLTSTRLDGTHPHPFIAIRDATRVTLINHATDIDL
jgi:hypothetical protein